MAISFSTPHEKFLHMHAARNEVLTTNLANADTPGYKARDYDFASALKQMSQEQSSFQMKKTSALHQEAWGQNRFGMELKYRTPTQPTLDGNTVDTDVEKAAFMENALRYRTSLRFVDGYFKGIRYALKGQ